MKTQLHNRHVFDYYCWRLKCGIRIGKITFYNKALKELKGVV